MVYRGIVQNGMVVPDQGGLLPEGARVEITIVSSPNDVPSSEPLPTLYEQLKHLVGKAEGLPSDLAARHDHYLHGVEDQ